MLIKIGDEIFSSKDAPIMVILSDSDKENIKNMLPGCNRYAEQNEHFDTRDDFELWMDNKLKFKDVANRSA